MSKALSNKLSKVLDSTGIFQSVDVSGGVNKISIMGRVINNSDAQWLALLTRILSVREDLGSEWECHLCKNFFLKNGQLVFGWNISLNGKNMSEIVDTITSTILHVSAPKKVTKSTTPPVDDDEEIPLTDMVVGGSAAELLPGTNVKDRNAPKPGSTKGAYSYTGGRAP